MSRIRSQVLKMIATTKETTSRSPPVTLASASSQVILESRPSNEFGSAAGTTGGLLDPVCATPIQATAAQFVLPRNVP